MTGKDTCTAVYIWLAPIMGTYSTLVANDDKWSDQYRSTFSCSEFYLRIQGHDLESFS